MTLILNILLILVIWFLFALALGILIGRFCWVGMHDDAPREDEESNGNY